MNCEIPHQFEKGTKHSLQERKNFYAFKYLEGKPERESPKRIVSASSGFELLQIVSKPVTGNSRARPSMNPERKSAPKRTVSTGGGLGLLQLDLLLGFMLFFRVG